ncbi:hypothetical protein TraAM80_00271 [Trypanosoma rangeli]|uniref:Uncharacterized protein n=1 Tax=Trypanosoma rangeli TaxID=5698 RepID=A0A422P4F0_TRYRA|nr:uncharacterized protein TraAM80_00271 [Trypanosoma rangeli]RNF12555.1 hypothetical protein TraAM80_00271 [Trypanosoma rangeli]|eukprot:RNF12555.1 hypothetical protein TraAM80_00271 [Trypanosoma rangeli]
MENESDYQNWGISKELEAVSTPLTPTPLLPSAHLLSSVCIETTRERLALLHSIIQRSLEHAEIPSPPTNKVHVTFPTPDCQGSSASTTGETAHLNSMEQLVLAQFESLGRTDILLGQSESYAAARERWYRDMMLMKIQIWGAHAFSSFDNISLTGELTNCETFHCNTKSVVAKVSYAGVDAATMTVPSFSVREALMSLLWQENNERQTLLLEEISEFNALILGIGSAGHYLVFSKRRDELVGNLRRVLLQPSIRPMTLRNFSFGARLKKSQRRK